MAKIYVVRGAIIRCSLGSMDSRIMIPVSHGVYAAGKPKLNINDYKEGQNITHFGICKKTGEPCSPKITGPWDGGQTNNLIEKIPALTNNCTTHCSCSGEISIVHHDQTPK